MTVAQRNVTVCLSGVSPYGLDRPEIQTVWTEHQLNRAELERLLTDDEITSTELFFNLEVPLPRLQVPTGRVQVRWVNLADPRPAAPDPLRPGSGPDVERACSRFHGSGSPPGGLRSRG